MKLRTKLWYIFLVTFHMATVENGATCWFSKTFWDVHDFYVDCGGDGWPSHFYEYKCWKCGKEFII